MAQVLELKDLDAFVTATIAQVCKGTQKAQRELGLPVYGLEEITFELVLLKDGGINAVLRENTSVQTGEQITVTETPEIVSVSEVERADKSVNTSKDERESSDKGTSSSTNQSDSDSTSTDDETATDSQNGQSTALVTRNTQETTTTEGSE